MYMYISINIYIYIYIYIYINIYKCIYIYIYTYTATHIFKDEAILRQEGARMSQVTRIDESYPRMNESSITYGWVISHVRMRHVPHVDKSWDTHSKWFRHLPIETQHGWVMWHVWMYIYIYTYMKEHGWVMLHVWIGAWISHITHVNGSDSTYEWVMLHV